MAEMPAEGERFSFPLEGHIDAVLGTNSLNQTILIVKSRGRSYEVIVADDGDLISVKAYPKPRMVSGLHASV